MESEKQQFVHEKDVMHSENYTAMHCTEPAKYI